MLSFNHKNKSLPFVDRRSTNWRRFAALFHDFSVSMFAWFVAYLLRFNFKIPSEIMPSLWQVAMLVIPLQVLFFIQFGLYKGVWRFASIPDLKRILKAIALAAITTVTLLYMFKPDYLVVPRSVLVLNPLLLMLLMGGSRFIYRSWK